MAANGGGTWPAGQRPHCSHWPRVSAGPQPLCRHDAAKLDGPTDVGRMHVLRRLSTCHRRDWLMDGPVYGGADTDSDSDAEAAANVPASRASADTVSSSGESVPTSSVATASSDVSPPIYAVREHTGRLDAPELHCCWPSPVADSRWSAALVDGSEEADASDDATWRDVPPSRRAVFGDDTAPARRTAAGARTCGSNATATGDYGCVADDKPRRSMPPTPSDVAVYSLSTLRLVPLTRLRLPTSPGGEAERTRSDGADDVTTCFTAATADSSMDDRRTTAGGTQSSAHFPSTTLSTEREAPTPTAGRTAGNGANAALSADYVPAAAAATPGLAAGGASASAAPAAAPPPPPAYSLRSASTRTGGSSARRGRWSRSSYYMGVCTEKQVDERLVTRGAAAAYYDVPKHLGRCADSAPPNMAPSCIQLRMAYRRRTNGDLVTYPIGTTVYMQTPDYDDSTVYYYVDTGDGSNMPISSSLCALMMHYDCSQSSKRDTARDISSTTWSPHASTERCAAATPAALRTLSWFDVSLARQSPVAAAIIDRCRQTNRRTRRPAVKDGDGYVLRAAGIVLTTNNYVLLVFSDCTRRWSVPCGKRWPDEESRATAVRLVRREAGVDALAVHSAPSRTFTEEEAKKKTDVWQLRLVKVLSDWDDREKSGVRRSWFDLQSAKEVLPVAKRKYLDCIGNA